MLKVLYCGFKYEYGRPQWGLGFEYQNFYEVLKRMEGVQAEGFFIDEKTAEAGRDVINALLIKTVEEQKPDLLFCFLFREELKKETIEYITKKTKTKTFNWFADDHWRLPIYSRYWAPFFTMVSTTDSQAISKYHRLGIKNVIKTQWAANHFQYFSQDPAKNKGDYEITFVGKNYGSRGKYIKLLKSKQLPVQAFGGGFDGGRVSQQQMLEIFSFSKINLNFTESPYVTAKERLKLMAKVLIQKQMTEYGINKHPFGQVKSFFGAQRRQIKGRTFEVPACGGFLLTGDADNLADYYIPGKEIAVFENQNDLAEKCKYYLQHEQERKAIAKAGYERTIKEHTYEQRFKEIFKALELE